MNAIIPQRQRVLNPKARPTIRAMISRCAAEVLIEEFGFGGSGEKLKRVEAEVDALLKKYSDNYSRYRNERRAMEALAADALEMGIDCRIRPGSGERVLVGHEHDMIFFLLPYGIEQDGRICWKAHGQVPDRAWTQDQILQQHV